MSNGILNSFRLISQTLSGKLAMKHFLSLTPDGDVDGEVRFAVGVLGLAGVPPGVGLGGVADPELGGDAVQLADLGGARLARLRQVLAPVLLPLDPENSSVMI